MWKETCQASFSQLVLYHISAEDNRIRRNKSEGTDLPSARLDCIVCDLKNPRLLLCVVLFWSGI